MTQQEAVDIVTSLFLLCGVFAPLAMCAGFGRNEKKTRRVIGAKPRRKISLVESNRLKAKTKKARRVKVKKVEPLSVFDQRIYDLYVFNRQFKAA